MHGMYINTQSEQVQDEGSGDKPPMPRGFWNVFWFYLDVAATSSLRGFRCKLDETPAAMDVQHNVTVEQVLCGYGYESDWRPAPLSGGELRALLKMEN